MDHLSQGRFILGLGVSGPQVVEGWYGKPFAKPLARTREYIEIIRKIVKRDGPVTHDGDHYRLPLEGGTGLGLSIVRRLVLDLGGSFRIETEPGTGTRATVEIPL